MTDLHVARGQFEWNERPPHSRSVWAIHCYAALLSVGEVVDHTHLVTRTKGSVMAHMIVGVDIAKNVMQVHWGGSG
ncbi:hypothetical protein OKW44_002136 [Paraburkholderia sp. WSM4174]